MSSTASSMKRVKGVLRSVGGSLRRRVAHPLHAMKKAGLSKGKPTSEELQGLSRERLVHLASCSQSDELAYQVLEVLLRLRNFKSAAHVASLLDMECLKDTQALKVATAMLSSDKGVEGDLLIEDRLRACASRPMDEQTALAFTKALSLSGLEITRAIKALEDIEARLEGSDDIKSHVRQEIKWAIFQLMKRGGLDANVLEFAELDRLNLASPRHQIRFLPVLKALGYQDEIDNLLRQLRERFPLSDPAMFVAQLMVSPLTMKGQGLKIEDFPESFFSKPQVFLPLAEQRKAMPLFDELYLKCVTAQVERYRKAGTFVKNDVLNLLLSAGEMDRALDLLESGVPNTVLPAVICRGMRYFSQDDYRSAKDCFFQALEEDPSNSSAAHGVRLALPRTGGTMRDLIDIRARIGSGRSSLGRLGILPGNGTDQTISLLMNGEYVAGLYSKRHTPSWQLLKSIYGRKFLNFEELPRQNTESLRLFVIGDEGVGDEIRTAQFYSQLADSFKEIMISCDPRLKSLFERSFPKIKFVPVWRFRKGLIERQDKLQGRIAGLNERLSNLLTEGCRPYLEAADVVTFGQNLFFNRFIGRLECPEAGPYLIERRPSSVVIREEPRKLRVGILWRSHLRTTWRQYMYLRVEDFAPLTNLPNVELWSIQHAIDSDETAYCRAHNINLIEDVDLFDDFEGMASRLKAMDLLIGISSAPIELGAALGIPVWMLGFSPENYFLRTAGGKTEADHLTMNSTIVAPQWIDFSAPRDECVDLVFRDVCKRLESLKHQ